MSEEIPESSSARVNTLVRMAQERGWEVEHTRLYYSRSPDSECWTLHGPGGLNLTVYPLPNQGAEVYLDQPGDKTWRKITQRDARLFLICNPVER